MRLSPRIDHLAATILGPLRSDVGVPRSDDRADPARTEGEARQRLLQKARQPGIAFRKSPYYGIAEPDMPAQWSGLIWPMIGNLDFSCVLELAAGHGRNSAKLAEFADRIILVDINRENIDFCKERFRGDSRFTFIKNDGVSLTEVADESVSLVYSFDSMVHFDSDVVREYLQEFRRVLKPGGSGFVHHSNYTGDPAGEFTKAPGWRNFMSKELFAHYCLKCYLEVVEQRVIDWSDAGLDCLSVFRKPIRSAA